MAIVTNTEACLRWLAADEPDLEHATEAAKRAVRNGHRAARVIASVRALARNASPHIARSNLAPLIGEVVDLMRAEFRRRAVSVHTTYADGLPTVMADRVQIQQVIVNLLLNGMEAVAGQQEEPAAVWIEASLADPPRVVVVAVSDTGAGVAPDLMHRMFDPLVTSKPDGMGLGLSICRTIVEAHHGRIWAERRVPRGTVIQFTLPLVQDGSATAS
jgi:signal transduction histidine kinase